MDRSWVLIALGGVLVLGGGVAALWSGRGSGEPAATAAFTVSASEAAAGSETAGCTTLDAPALPPTPHLDTLEGAPSAAELYPNLRPTASGRHLGARVHAIGAVDAPPDERITTHNLEHGAVIVFYDPQELPDEDEELARRWASGWNDAGFDEHGEAGVGVIAAPYDGAFTSGKALALRAWNVAVDCDRFDVPVADRFLAEHFGDRGQAPEGHLGPYPSDVLEVVP